MSKLNVAMCPSVNGFGHIRRLLSISLTMRLQGCNVVFVFPNSATQKQISLVVKHKFETILVDIEEIEFAYQEGPFAKERNLAFDNQLSSVRELKKFNLVLADTVSWPCHFSKHAIFIGQFSWEMYYEHQKNSESKTKTNSLLDFKQLFGMKLFSWDELIDLKNFTNIELLDYWNLREKKISKRINQIGIASNGIIGISTEINGLEPVEIKGIPEYLMQKKELPQYLLMRAGLGNILEGLAARCSIFLTNDSESLDVTRNREKLIDLGLAVEINSISKMEYQIINNHRINDEINVNMISSGDLALEILRGF